MGPAIKCYNFVEETLARACLRRVEVKECVFAEGDPTTHVFPVGTGAVA
jgi:hypothetical protein